MSTPRFVLLIGFALPLAWSAQAVNAQETGTAQPAAGEQAPAENLPEAAGLFERHIEALGGRDAVFAVKNRRLKGVYSGIPFLFPVRMEVWHDAPDKFRLRLDEPAGRSIEVRYNGDTGWRMISGSGVEQLEGVSLRELIDTADFYGQSNYKDRYEAIETVASGEVEGVSVYIVKATWENGHVQFLFFNTETGLFSGSRYATIGPDGSAREVVIMVDQYTEIDGGVKYPKRVRQLLAGEPEPIVMTYKSIEFNVDDGHAEYGEPDPED